jgi:hypothetical protein
MTFAVDAVHVAVELLNPDGMFFGTVDDLGVLEGAADSQTCDRELGDKVMTLP